MSPEILGAILSALCISHVDWWVLDVEGAELTVLRGVDWNAITIDVITVEADGGQPEKDAGVIALLRATGYVHDGRFSRNEWFHRRGFEPRRGHGQGAPRTIMSNSVVVEPLPQGWAVYQVDRTPMYHRAEPSWQSSEAAPPPDPTPLVTSQILAGPR